MSADAYRLARLESEVADLGELHERFRGLLTTLDDLADAGEVASLRERLDQLEILVGALGETVGRLSDRATPSGAGGDLVSRAEVLRLIEEHGWSVRA